MQASENVFDYQAEAQQTKSSSFHGGIVAKQQFINAMVDAIKSLQKLDVIKKALFYGKQSPELFHIGEVTQTCNNLQMSAVSDSPHVGIDLIHGIIGKATEAGELLEALFDASIYGKPLDATNVKEEVGDGFWYDAIILDALQSNFGECQVVNIAKLRQRFPNKFTEYDAKNRDLSKERAILESHPQTVR